MQNTSPKFAINFTDLWKTIRGGLITLAAAAVYGVLAFVSAHYTGWSYQICLSTSTTPFCFDTAFVAVPAIGAVLELVRRFLTDHSITDPNAVS